MIYLCSKLEKKTEKKKTGKSVFCKMGSLSTVRYLSCFFAFLNSFLGNYPTTKLFLSNYREPTGHVVTFCFVLLNTVTFTVYTVSFTVYLVDMKSTYSILAHICSEALPWQARKVLPKREDFISNPITVVSQLTYMYIIKNVPLSDDFSHHRY